MSRFPRPAQLPALLLAISLALVPLAARADEQGAPAEVAEVVEAPADPERDEAGAVEEEDAVPEQGGETQEAAEPQGDVPAQEDGSPQDIAYQVQDVAVAAGPSVSYEVHVQNQGWKRAVADGALAGTEGRSLRLEALRIRLSGISGNVAYRAHVQDVGWQGWVSGGALAGTQGRSKRVEAVELRLTGDALAFYDIEYRVHVQNVGWTGWARNGATAGTTGRSLRVEAIEIRLVPRNATEPGVSYSAHVQNVGWQQEVANGATAGAPGKSLRVEALKARLLGIGGNISCQVHAQDFGWRPAVTDGLAAGVTGQAKRAEALRMSLTGAAKDQGYHLYYRTYVQGFGWLGWARDGQTAGSTSMSLRIEGVQARLMAADAGAPKNDGVMETPYVTMPTVSYSVYSKGAWGGAATGGKTAGTTGKSLAIQGIKATVDSPYFEGSINYCVRAVGGDGFGAWYADGAGNPATGNVEAVQVKLTDALADRFDIYYRVHSADLGWLGWARNGASAGSEGRGKAIEAVQMAVVLKGGAAPGATSGAYLIAPLLNGIDVASHQAGINLATVPADFVIVKATESTNYLNPYFRQWAAQALKLNKKLGIYHFVSAHTTAVAQARYFVNTIQPYVGKAILVLDWEDATYSSVLGKGPSFAKQFLDEVYRLTGVKPVIYMSRSVTTSYDWTAVTKAGYELWVAQYLYRYYDTKNGIKGYVNNPTMGSSTYCGAWSKPLIYQYTSTGLLSGWKSFLDLNVFYGSRSTWDYYARKR